MTTGIQASMGRREWLMLLTLSLLWGGSFFFVELVVQELPPLIIVLVRVGLAAPLLWLLVAILRSPLPRQPGIWSAFALMGLINNVVPFALIVWGQTQIASGLAAILNATTPMFTVLVAGILLADEPFTPRKLCAVLLGLGGVVVLIGPDLLGGLGEDLPAQIAVLGAALSYALAGVYGRRFHRLQIDPVVTAAGQVTASALILLPLAMLATPATAWQLPGPLGLASLLALAWLSTALAYILYFRILATSGATNLLLVTLLVPVSAILLGAGILGERLAPAQFGGMLLIAFGLAVMDGRPLALLRRVAG